MSILLYWSNNFLWIFRREEVVRRGGESKLLDEKTGKYAL